MLQIFIFLLALAPALSPAYSTFDSSCTIPNVTTNFVSGPDTRGTLDILWSCLFTIIACTWTIQHLNVPEQREGRDPGWRGDLKWQLKSFWTSLKWMLTTIIAPEVLLGKALGDFVAAKRDHQELSELAAEDGVPWSLTHTLLANMGGFVLRAHTDSYWNTSADSEVTTMDESRLDSVVLADRAPEAVSTVREASGLPDQNGPEVARNDGDKDLNPELPQVTPNPFHLSARQMIKLRRSRNLNKLPFVTEVEINDKSKSDVLVKAIAVGQITWILLQIIVRAARRLPISQLEIAVLAFSTCAIIIYGVNWKKPKGVNVPFTIDRYPHEIPLSIISPITPVSTNPHNESDSIFGYLWLDFILSNSLIGSPIRNDIPPENSNGHALLWMLMGCTVFGGLHLAAWNFDFPTRSEQILWRASDLYVTSYPLIWACILLVSWSTDALFGYGENLNGILMKLSTMIYILARLFLLVEIFRTLCFLPPDSYVTTWATDIPHLA